MRCSSAISESPCKSNIFQGGISPDFPGHAFQSPHSWQSSFLGSSDWRYIVPKVWKRNTGLSILSSTYCLITYNQTQDLWCTSALNNQVWQLMAREKKLEIFLYPRSRESHLGKQANCLKSAPTCTANMNSKSIHHISWRWCMHCRKTCCAQVWKESGKG